MSYRQPTLSAYASLYPDAAREALVLRAQAYATAEALAVSWGVNPRTLARVLVALGIREEVHAILKGNRECTRTQ